MAVNFLNVLGAAGKVGAGMQQAEAASRAAQEDEMRLAGLRQEQRERGRMSALQQALAERAATATQFAPMEAQSPALIGRRAGVAAPQPAAPEQPKAEVQPAAGLTTPAALEQPKVAAQPAAPAAPAAPVEPTAAPQDTYGPELRQALAMREQQVAQYNDLANLARMHQMTGTAQGLETAAAIQQRMNDLRTGINQLDGNMFYLQGRQGLAEFSDLGDSSRLEAVLGEYVGAPVSIKAKGDDLFDIYVGGKLQPQNKDLSMNDVSGFARSYFDSGYVDMMATRAQKEFEAQIDLRKLMAVENRKDARALLKNVNDQAVAQIRSDNKTNKVTVHVADDAVYAVAGSSVYRVVPGEEIEMPDGTTQMMEDTLELVGSVAK